MKHIQTGVDRLIALLHERHKLSLDEAAKTLAVPKLLVQEWTSLLEEEGVVDVKYSFSKTYLFEKGLSDAERLQQEKTQSTERETYILQAETLENQIKEETVGFEQFRTYYEQQREAWRKELEHLLRQADAQDAPADKLLEQKDAIVRSHQQINERQTGLETAIMRLHERYQELVRSFRTYEEALATHRQHMHDTVAFSNDVAAAFQECSKMIDAMRADMDALAKASPQPAAPLPPPPTPSK